MVDIVEQERPPFQYTSCEVARDLVLMESDSPAAKAAKFDGEIYVDPRNCETLAKHWSDRLENVTIPGLKKNSVRENLLHPDQFQTLLIFAANEHPILKEFNIGDGDLRQSFSVAALGIIDRNRRAIQGCRIGSPLPGAAILEKDLRIHERRIATCDAFLERLAAEAGPTPMQLRK